MSLGIDTRVETTEVPHHSHGHSCCYLLDFFPNRRLQLNQITWMMFHVCILLLLNSPKGRNRTAQYRAKDYVLYISAVRDDVPRKELPQVTHCSLWDVRSGPILL